MNLIRKGHRHAHRGVIGVESAIVMIAFVIVAAALAFVVLNMGFSTTQKAKATIISSLGEASSSLEVAGKVLGYQDGAATTKLKVISIPLKIASGGNAVNLQNTTASVKYLSNSVEYDNIYAGVASTTRNSIDVTEGWEDAVTNLGAGSGIANNPMNETWAGATKAIVYWNTGFGNQILDLGEHANLSIVYDKGDVTNDERPSALDKIRVEVILPTGAPLTVERDIPNVTTSVVDLG